MHKHLRKLYLSFIVPVIVLFSILGLAKEFSLISVGQFVLPSFLSAVFFVLSAITALAGPLFLRTIFAHAMREKNSVPETDFLKFEKGIICLSMVSPYFSFIAVLCEFPKFYSASIVILSLYAAYYYFPSQKRINFDKKIFRIK